MNRTIKELLKKNGRVYVYLENSETGNQFMKQAESEGFTFTDGTKPTKRCYAEIMAVNRDITINYVGMNGRIAFGSEAKTVGGEELIRVDFKKYVAGDNDYLFRSKQFNKKPIKKMRVWWMPQLGTNATFYIPVNSIEEASKFIDILTVYDEFQYEKNIKPNFSNVGGVQVWNDEEQDWVDWHENDNGDYYDEIDEYIDTLDNSENFRLFREELMKQVSFPD